jgi:hypothetical protein
MNKHPITTALEQLDVEPSSVFREELRASFVSALSIGEVRADFAKRVAGHAGEEEETVKLIDEEAPRRGHPRIIVGTAAAIIVAAALTAVVLNHRTETDTADASADRAIAESALITTEVLGAGWKLQPPGGPTSRSMAEIAATVPECSSYVDYAFDSARRKAVTAERTFRGRSAVPLIQYVYLFPTEAAATTAMDKISEAGFAQCLDKFIDALTPIVSSLESKTSTIEGPPVKAHGDRQVLVGQSIVYQQVTKYTVMNFFVQVGRGIVYIDPTADSNDDLGPAGQIEKTLDAVTAALAAALESP